MQSPMDFTVPEVLFLSLLSATPQKLIDIEQLMAKRYTHKLSLPQLRNAGNRLFLYGLLAISQDGNKNLFAITKIGEDYLDQCWEIIEASKKNKR